MLISQHENHETRDEPHLSSTCEYIWKLRLTKRMWTAILEYIVLKRIETCPRFVGINMRTKWHMLIFQQNVDFPGISNCGHDPSYTGICTLLLEQQNYSNAVNCKKMVNSISIKCLSSAWSTGCKGATLNVSGISFIMQSYVSEDELFRCCRLQLIQIW